MMWVIYPLAAIGAYRVYVFIREEIIKPKPSYGWMFQGLRGPQNGH